MPNPCANHDKSAAKESNLPSVALVVLIPTWLQSVKTFFLVFTWFSGQNRPFGMWRSFFVVSLFWSSLKGCNLGSPQSWIRLQLNFGPPQSKILNRTVKTFFLVFTYVICGLPPPPNQKSWLRLCYILIGKDSMQATVLLGYILRCNMYKQINIMNITKPKLSLYTCLMTKHLRSCWVSSPDTCLMTKHLRSCRVSSPDHSFTHEKTSFQEFLRSYKPLATLLMIKVWNEFLEINLTSFLTRTAPSIPATLHTKFRLNFFNNAETS